jgi:hypothetical protein
MIGFSISFALGIWLLQQQAVLPELHWGAAIIFLFFAYLLPTTNQWQSLP